MIRARMLIRLGLLLGVIAATEAAAELAAAQVACAPGYYYDPLYGCLIAGEAYVQPIYPSRAIMVTLLLSMLGAASIVRTSRPTELTWVRLSAAADTGIADHAPMAISATRYPCRPRR